MRFANRIKAGQQLAALLADYANWDNALVMALPRGGVPVAYEVANALNIPLDLLLVRKLGVPGSEELAMGAIASGGMRVLNSDVIEYLNIPEEAIDAIAAREQIELERRTRKYRGNLPEPELTGRTVILVDDGLATGTTMQAAVAAAQAHDPARIIVAVPVASRSSCEKINRLGKDISCVCVYEPEDLSSVGERYYDFSQTTDEEVCDLMARAAMNKKPEEALAKS